MKEVKEHWKKWIFWFTLGAAIIVLYKGLDNFVDIIEQVKKIFTIIGPFLIGIFIAYVLYMPCKSIEDSYRKSKNKFIRKRARGLSVLTVYIIAILTIMIIINVILPVVIESVRELFNNIQGYIETAVENYNSLSENSILKSEMVKEIVKNVQNIDIKQYFQIEKIIEYLVGAINVVTGVFNVFVAVIVSIYILLERTQILKFIKRTASAMFKTETYKNIGKYFNHSNEIFFNFIASQFIDGIIIGVLVTGALMIMKIKFAPLLGFIIGLFNMIPYFGAIIAVIIAALITFISGTLSQTIWLLIVVIILQQIDANIINPKIVGKSLKISPLLIIFAVTIGGAYFGIAGMFFAVPVVAVIKILIEDYIDLKLAVKQKEEAKEEAKEETKED